MSDKPDVETDLSPMQEKLAELQEHQQRRSAFQDAYEEQLKDEIMPIVEDIMADYIDFHTEIVDSHECDRDDCEVIDHPDYALKQDILAGILADIAAEAFTFTTGSTSALAVAYWKYMETNHGEQGQNVQVMPMQGMGGTDAAPIGDPGDYIG